MLDDPEFEPEFYAHQISMMEKRYAIIFKRWSVSWTAYYKFVCKSLRNRQYWIWVYLAGFERFINDQVSEKSKGMKDLLKKDAISRIKRIIGDSFKIEKYIKSL